MNSADITASDDEQTTQGFLLVALLPATASRAAMRLALGALTMTEGYMTQRDMDVAEIEAAVRLIKRGSPVRWTALREAVERLERLDGARGEEARKES